MPSRFREGGRRHIFSGTQTSRSVSSCTQHGEAVCAPSAANVPPSQAHRDQVLPQSTCLEHCSAISKAQHEVLEQQHCPESERGNSVYTVKMETAKRVVSFWGTLLRWVLASSVSLATALPPQPQVYMYLHTQTWAHTSLYILPAESRSF